MSWRTVPADCVDVVPSFRIYVNTCIGLHFYVTSETIALPIAIWLASELYKRKQLIVNEILQVSDAEATASCADIQRMFE